MPLNYPQLQPQIIELGKTAVKREDRLRILREKANELLENRAQDVAALRAKVERAVKRDPNLRCAVPVSEPLTGSYPLPDLPADIVLLAADGSQIYPDKHSGTNYYAINVGGILLNLSEPAAPKTFVESKLKLIDDMYEKYGSISEKHVKLERDLAERKYLSLWVEDYFSKDEYGHLMITLTDGPLELWGNGDKILGKESEAVQEAFDEYTKTLYQLLECGAITAGYVDKPRADLVVRLLEIAQSEEKYLSEEGRNRPFRRVADADLFISRLKSGERSAVFCLQSQNSHKYPENLKLHFFYLNVGYKDHPKLARVEIPIWVAENTPKLNALHAVLIQQCQTLGAKPYPYLLHRSHEIAVVTFKERDMLTDMINQERRRCGAPTSQASNKHELKNLGGRKSYK